MLVSSSVANCELFEIFRKAYLFAFSSVAKHRLKGGYTIDALTAISRIIEAYKGNTCGGVSFRDSYS